MSEKTSLALKAKKPPVDKYLAGKLSMVNIFSFIEVVCSLYLIQKILLYKNERKIAFVLRRCGGGGSARFD